MVGTGYPAGNQQYNPCFFHVTKVNKKTNIGYAAHTITFAR